MNHKIECSACGRSSSSLLDYKCHSCGQPLVIQTNIDFEKRKIKTQNYTAWRYTEFFPYVKEVDIITLGEGWTPLVKFSEKVYFKLENLNPTGSFKDRGSAVLISALHKSIEKSGGYISEDSSGNAGASVAAYAGRADLKARIYVPETVSGSKFNQIRSYGAEVVKVQGSRARVAEEAQKAESGKFYLGHIVHPLFRDGIRSLVYEMVEQFAWNVPKRIYLPVSAGTLLLGVISGFRHLVDSNVLDSVPNIIACQTRQVSPLYHRFKDLSYTQPKRITSIADALVSTNPPLLELMVKDLKEAKGDVMIVEEDEMMKAYTELARKGFFVEPSSAVAYAAYKKQAACKEISRDDTVAVVLTGTGLKTTLKPN